MKLHHIAIWTFRLEELKDFYVRFLGGTSNEKYINPKKGFESYFISFDEGPTLELMSRVDVQNTPIEENRRGLTHLAFTFPSKEEILRFTEEMRSEGYTIAGEPRTSDTLRALYSTPTEIVWNVYTRKNRKQKEPKRLYARISKRNVCYCALFRRMTQKHSLPVARTPIWGIMPDGLPTRR